MAEIAEWVLLAYRLPREPSTPRVTIWRKLSRLGVAQILDGLVALPASAPPSEQLGWIADEIVAAGGEATIWVSKPVSKAQQRQLVSSMVEQVISEYEKVSASVKDAEQFDEDRQRRSLAQLRRELQRIALRDYFPPPQRKMAEQAVRSLGRLVGAAQ
jgi:hypothetical protein